MASRLLSVNLLYSFIAAALAVIVPLYLLDRNVDVASIGIVLSVAPIAFMVLRIFFASIADSVGTKTIAFVYSLANLLAVLIYLFTTSTLIFMGGTLMEGVRNSGFWAISRTEILMHNGRKVPGSILAHFSGIRQVADGLGRLSIGFLIAYLAFAKSFMVLIAISILLVVLVASMNGWRPGNLFIGKGTVRRILNNRPRGFWFNALGLTSISITSNMLLAFLLPIYAYSVLRFSFEQTGLIVALFSLISGLAMMLLMWRKAGSRPLMLLTAMMVPALIAFPFLGSNIILLIIILAIGNGCSMIMSEYLLADAVAGSDEVSTDIGLIYMPLRIAEFLFLFLGGFVIALWGYAPLFVICALCVGFFLIYARGHFS